MSDDRLDYESFVADALRGVVRRALELVARRGLPGDHHFYITVRSNAPGVALPLHLRAQYPEQITLVLQHQFHDLKVDEQGFGVSLSFGGKVERLSVPFAAVMAFVDPAVNFGLPIQIGERDGATGPAETPPPAPQSPEPKPTAPGAEASVVRLDQFRKK